MSHAAMSSVFRALADPTRRGVIERLSRSPAAVSELAEPYAMALPSFLQHLKVLEDCGLVRSQKRGRVRTYRLLPRRLERAEGWLAQHPLTARELECEQEMLGRLDLALSIS